MRSPHLATTNPNLAQADQWIDASFTADAFGDLQMMRTCLDQAEQLLREAGGKTMAKIARRNPTVDFSS